MRDVKRGPGFLCFGPFRLDIAAGALYGGSHRIPLQEQSFQLLEMLVEQPGEVLTRDDIRKKLWPNGTVVEFDHSINAAVKKVRLALDDSAEKPRYIETVARRGYRFMLPINRLEAEPTGAVAWAVPQGASQVESELPAANQTGKKISHYRVLEILGGGGMGVVYAAEDIKLGRRVALKFLPEEFANDARALERLEQEARAASTLNHPNICTIHEFGEHKGQPFIVMELLEGQTLRDRITGATRFPIERFLDLAIQITQGLEAAHQKGLIHRDIKPTNIFITSRGEAKILDFGLARIDTAPELAAPIYQTDSAAGLHLTRTGIAMGTAGYMSPEQVRAEKLDARTDLFSFGLVLYEMLTGRQAFSGETAAILRDSILYCTPPRARELNPGLPPKLEEIIDRALQKDRLTRYQTALEIRANLEELKRGVESGRSGAGRWAVAAGVLALLVIGSVMFRVTNRPPASASGLPELKQRQLTTNPGENPVLGGEISPDGKYLAYSDADGIQIKLLATGEVKNIRQPGPFRGKHVEWGVSWFPDSTRILAGGGVLGERAALWTVPVMGGVLRKLRDDAGDQFAVSPNGSSIAFTTNPGRYFNREIWLLRADGEKEWKLFESDEDSGFWKIAWSPDGGRLAYIKYRETPDSIQAVVESRDLKGGPPTTVLSGPLVTKLRDFLWLPDGRMIYLLAEPDINLYSCNYWQQQVDTRTGAPRGGLRQLTNWAGFCMDDTSATADGKRLAFKRWWVQRSVHVADLEFSGTHITSPTRLTRSEGNELPMAWTADSRAVLFVSNRTGSWGIFKQHLQEKTAEQIVTGLENSIVPSVSPDGVWVLYVIYPKEDRSSTPPQLMRAPITGGQQQRILTANISGQRCARSPATLCALAERTPNHKQLIFTSFDPVKGRGRELIRFNIDPNAGYAWDLSPDGTRIGICKSGEGRVHILSLGGHTTAEIRAKGGGSLETLNWAADGRGLFCASRTQQSSVLLYVDLQGNTHPVWEREGTLGNESPGTSGIPSPNGRHLAMMSFTLNGNIWMVEGF